MITALVVQPDGKIIVAGGFTNLGGAGRTGLARLLNNGPIDPDFAPLLEVRSAGVVPNLLVRTVALQPDGKLILGGNFTHVNGAEVIAGLARLEVNGALDTSFQPTNTIPFIFDLTCDAGGRVLVGGCQFEGWEDVGPKLMRLDAAGRLDREFDLPPGVDQPVRSVLVLSDGKIVVNGLYRFLPDGGMDPGFSPPPFQFVSLRAVALQAVHSNARGKPTFQKLVAAGIPNNPPRWPEATAIVKRILKAYKENPRDWERVGEWIERIGWPRFFELVELPFTKYHIDNWRGARKSLNSSSYVRF